jgi:cytochrome c oxidase subunit 1
MLNEKLGKANFWLMLIGFNLTFGPMHILGLEGMSRRTYTYDSNFGFELWNRIATIGAYTLAISVFLFIFNIFYSRKKAKDLPPPGPDPWDARTIEWMIPSPAPAYNFDPAPTVTRVDDFWYRKYADTPDHRLVRIAKTEDVVQHGDGKNAHLPSPSYWPIFTAFGLPIIAYGIIFSLWLSLVGGAIVVIGLYGWAFEAPDDPDVPSHHDDHGPDSHADSAGELGAGDGETTDEGDDAAGDEPPAGDKEAEPVG